jgi:predicted MPP superfamily phosphohydrolase
MKESEDKQFFNFLDGCGIVYGREIKPELAKIFFNLLKEYDFKAIEKSFNAHIRESKFFPTPADIIQNIPKSKMYNHIGADEAWQVALNSMDERTSVIVNEEILKAREIAMDIYYSGDKVGARMAFRDAYNRIIRENDKPKWFVSLGHDPKGREHVQQEFNQLLLSGNTSLDNILEFKVGK